MIRVNDFVKIEAAPVGFEHYNGLIGRVVEIIPFASVPQYTRILVSFPKERDPKTNNIQSVTSLFLNIDKVVLVAPAIERLEME